MYIAPAEFHTWAQQSLNRIPGIQFKINGDSHEVYPEYKDAVRAFQKNFIGQVNGVVDERTYNALITNNHIHPDYNRWIRQSLAKAAGKPGLTVGTGHTPDLIKAIRDYQNSKKGALNVDGWVGVKTELVLNLETGVKIPIPNPDGPVSIPLEVKVTRWLERMADELGNPVLPKDLQFVRHMHPDDQKSFVKFVKLLELGTIDYRYYDWMTAKDFVENRLGEDLKAVKPANALFYLRNLMRYYENINSPQVYYRFALRCQEVWKDVDQGLFQIIYQQKNSSADGITKGRVAQLMDWVESRKTNYNHILNAWPEWKGWNGKWN